MLILQLQSAKNSRIRAYIEDITNQLRGQIIFI